MTLFSILPKLLTILTSTFVLCLTTWYMLKRLQNTSSTPKWLQILGSTWRASAAWLIGGYGLILAIESSTIGDYIFISSERFIQLRSLYLVFAITWLFFTWKTQLESFLIERAGTQKSSANDRALIFALGKLTSIFFILIMALTTLRVLHIPIEAILAFGGIGGLAISWAGKDIVANLFGGLMIYIQRPFAVGDWISSPNKNFEGVVEDIGWYMTRIRSFARRPVYIPNATITDAIVENPQRMYNRRIKETIGIRYCDANKLQNIVNDIEAMLKGHPEIDKKQILMVHFVSFGPSALEIEVYTFTKTTVWAKWRTIQQEIFLKIIEIIDAHGAQIAFPTTTVLLEKETAPTQLHTAFQS